MSNTSPLPYRLAAIDLDDTLLGPDKRISAANARAVNRLRDAGIRVVLASGRRYENMMHFHQQLGLDGPIVSCNGAFVRDTSDGAILLNRPLPAPLARELITEGEKRGVTMNYYHQNGGLFTRERNGWTELYQSRTGSEITPVGDLLHEFPDDAPLKIIWIHEGDANLTLQDEMRARYGDQLFIVITDPEYLEFMAPGVNKSVGLQAVAERYDIPQSAVVAFGDGNNDVEMLRWAGMGIAMSHGRESAKRAADRVAPSGDPETELARAVELLLGAEASEKVGG